MLNILDLGKITICLSITKYVCMYMYMYLDESVNLCIGKLFFRYAVDEARHNHTNTIERK